MDFYLVFSMVLKQTRTYLIFVYVVNRLKKVVDLHIFMPDSDFSQIIIAKTAQYTYQPMIACRNDNLTRDFANDNLHENKDKNVQVSHYNRMVLKPSMFVFTT